jgi:hypothetical protein
MALHLQPFPWVKSALVAVLFLIMGMAYHPSVGHGPRDDQWCFLLDTIDQHGFLDTLSHSYSYNRTRAVAPGDYQLFRPVLFALLSAEKALFGNHFAWWQWVGIGLHGAAVFLFLQILLLAYRCLPLETARDGSLRSWFTERRLLHALAYVLALFFGLNFAGVEMVIWSHINGYLLFIVLILGAVFLVLKVVVAPRAAGQRTRVQVAGAYGLLLVSAFTYELGQFLAVLVGAVLGLSTYRNGRPAYAVAWFLLFASVLPLYQAVNLLDRAAHPRAWDATMTGVATRALSLRSVENTGRYLLYTTVQPFFPSCATWVPEKRVVITEPATFWEKYAQPDPVLLASLGVLGAGLWLTGRGLAQFANVAGRLVRLVMVLLPLSLLALHALVTVLGRMNLRSNPWVLSGNSYYTYLPLLGLLASLYVVWTWAAPRTTRPGSLGVLGCHAILVLGLVVLSVVSGTQVYAINVAEKNQLRPLRIATNIVQEFIDCHQAEPDFSIAFDGSVCASVQTFYGIPFPLILFKRYVNNDNPRYVFTMAGGKIVPRAGPGLLGGERRSPLFPDVVQVDTFYSFFHFDGWFYGVQYWDGYYRPDRMEYAYLIKARTLDDARRQVAEKLAEQEADCQAGRFIRYGSAITPVAAYGGFELFRAAGRIYAIPAPEGPLDRTGLLHQRYSCYYCGQSVEGVKAQIASTAFTEARHGVGWFTFPEAPACRTRAQCENHESWSRGSDYKRDPFPPVRPSAP